MYSDSSMYSIALGGKVLVIGVGKDEQVVSLFCHSVPVVSQLKTRHFQFPFMHLSANEIDVNKYGWPSSLTNTICSIQRPFVLLEDL